MKKLADLDLSEHKPTITFYIDEDTMNIIGDGEDLILLNQPEALRTFTKFTKDNQRAKNQNRVEHGENYVKELVQYPTQSQIIFASNKLIDRDLK